MREAVAAPTVLPPLSLPMPGSSSRSARRSLVLFLLLSLAGLALAAQLTVLRPSVALSGLCSSAGEPGCDAIAASPHALLFGVPLSLWGMLGFGSLAALAASGLTRERPHAGWPAGLLFAGAAFAALVSIGLAVLSQAVIGALCLLCAATWAVSGGLFVLGWRLARESGGVRCALRLDLEAARARPGRTAVLVLTLAGGVAFLIAHAALRH